MKTPITFFRSARGNGPVEKYLEALEYPEAARIYATLHDIEFRGLKKTTVQFRAVEGKLWELKLGRHRFFYVIASGPKLVCLHACKKQGRKARQDDLDLARYRLKLVLSPA